MADEALQASMSSVAQLAKALHLSPSTIRRWRRGAASPKAANLRRLEERLGAGLIQSPSQASLQGLSAWVEVGGIASSLCLKAPLTQPIST